MYNPSITAAFSRLRVGLGYDVHAFAPDRKLILGGVDIPHHQGLAGHSDADVLAHAVSDALLGAIRGGDIGKLFPDTDPAYKLVVVDAGNEQLPRSLHVHIHGRNMR